MAQIQNNRPRSFDILKERENALARKRRYMIPTIEGLNIKHDQDNAITKPVSNTSTHLNLMNDYQYDKPTLENV